MINKWNQELSSAKRIERMQSVIYTIWTV